jgi:hypothetical protein
MAGCGVEYVFGYSKRYFRKHNDCVTRNLRANVDKSLAPDVVTSPRIWKFGRRAWMYQRMYIEMSRTNAGGVLSFELLEKTMMEKKKTHRNILEIERNFLVNIDGPVHSHVAGSPNVRDTSTRDSVIA